MVPNPTSQETVMDWVEKKQKQTMLYDEISHNAIMKVMRLLLIPFDDCFHVDLSQFVIRNEYRSACSI